MRLNPAIPDPHGHLAREIERILANRAEYAARRMMGGLRGYCEYQAQRRKPNSDKPK